jgi:hypothetical protein
VQGTGDAGTAHHAPWATSVGHWARIVREAAPRSGRGRACLGTLPQLGTTARALRCPPLRARETRRPQAHPRRAWRRTVSQRPPPPPEAETTHLLSSQTWPLVHSHSVVMDSNTPAGGARQGQTGAGVAPPCVPTRPIWTRCTRCSGGRTCPTHPVGLRRAERAQRARRVSARGRGR